MSATSTQQQEDVRKLAKMIKGIRMAMLTTAMPDGTLRSRPMATQEKEFDGELWFFTDAESAKVHEVRDDSHVNLAYADPSDQRYVSISGRATVVRDANKARELWNPFVKAYFPGGPDDPKLVLLKVEVDQAEYWESSSSKMVHVLGMLKAAVTGNRYEPGHSEKVQL